MRLVDIYEEALELVGISGESMIAQHLNSARRTYALMLESQTARHNALFALADKLVSLGTGDDSFLLNADEIDIVYVSFRDTDNHDRPGEIMGFQEWFSLPDKTLTGTPDRLYVDRGFTASRQSKVWVWQIPDRDDYTVVAKVIKYIDPTGDWGDDPRVPAYWNNVLVWDLAERLAYKWAPMRVDGLKKKRIEEERSGRAADSPQSDVIFTLPRRGRRLR